MNEKRVGGEDRSIEVLSLQLGERLHGAQLHITTAESCTGGLVAGAITEIAGSSEWFERGFVTYSNEAKQALLHVDAGIFDRQGAVSEACVTAMAVGALKSSGADVAISVSGIAGPGGATVGKPVGTVWIGWAFRGSKSQIDVDAEVFTFAGDRRQVRYQAVSQALRGTISRIDNAGLLNNES